MKGKQGQAFICGINDIENDKALAHLAVQSKQVTDNNYHFYELGPCLLTPRMYIWADPASNEDNITAIWVDRIWLIKP